MAVLRSVWQPALQGSRAGAAQPVLPPRASSRPLRRPSIAPRASSQPEQRSTPPGGGAPGGGGGSSGGGGSAASLSSLSRVIQQAIEEYDDYTVAELENIKKHRRELEGFDDQIAEMEKEGPSAEWGLKLMRGTRRTMEKLISDETKRHAALTAARATYVAGVRQLEAELRTDPPPTPLNNAMSGALALAGYNWAVADGPRGSPEQLAALLRQAAANTSSPATILWATVVAGLFSSAFMGWAGGLFGVDAYRLLHEAPNWAAAAPSWLGWTAPYVGGTLGAYLVNPAAVAKVPLIAITSDQRNFYTQIPLWALAAAALGLAYSDCLVYQGLWLDTFSGWMGGSRDPFSLVDADLLADGVRASMGTLVGAPRLPAFLVVPGAALLAGLLQGAIFYGAQALRASDFMDLSDLDQRIDAAAEAAAEDSEVGGQAYLFPARRGGPGSDTATAAFASIFELGAEHTLTQQELQLAVARVVLAGGYLGVEAAITGSLWLAAGTSAAGMLTAMLLSRSQVAQGGRPA